LPAKAAPKRSKSVLKRARQAKARTLKNKSVKNTLRTLAKHVEKMVTEKNTEGARAALKKAVSETDKAVRSGIMHRNTASRTVSRLTILVNSMQSSEAA